MTRMVAKCVPRKVAYEVCRMGSGLPSVLRRVVCSKLCDAFDGTEQSDRTEVGQTS